MRGRRALPALIALVFCSQASAASHLIPVGCWGRSVGCKAAPGMFAADAMAISPDGRNLYAASFASDSVHVFARRAHGALVAKACFVNKSRSRFTGGDQPAHCKRVSGLGGPEAIAVSSDGKDVYVGGLALTTFRRGAHGKLTRLGASPLGDTYSQTLAISPDGRSVYAGGEGTLYIFARHTSGRLTRKGCLGSGKGCTPAGDLNGIWGVTVSPDSRNVYLAVNFADALVVFARGARGGLRKIQCFGNNGSYDSSDADGPQDAAGPRGCKKMRGLDGAFTVAVSPDGRNVYLGSLQSNAVVVFARRSDGRLRRQGCIGATGEFPGPRGCRRTPGLGDVQSVAVSPDGKNVYAASGFDDMVAFSRRADGHLTPAEYFRGQHIGPKRCRGAKGIDSAFGASSVAVSPDSKHVYLGAEAITAFVQLT